MIFVGVDLGMTGAAAMIDHNRKLGVADLPIEGGRVQARQLIFMLREWVLPYDACTVIYENVLGQSFAGKGGHNTLASRESLARCRGIVEAVCDIAGWKAHAISPQKWQRALGLYGKPKSASRELAQRIFPSMGEHLKLVKHHNRADALLMAYWGLKELA